MDLSPLYISIKTAMLSTIITFFVGIYVSYKMALYNGKYKGILDGLFIVPLVLPPTVIGFFLLLILGKNGLIGKILLYFDKNIIFSWSATVISAVVVSFPMMYRSCRASFEQVDNSLILCARTLGLSEWHIFRKIAMPLAYPGIIGGIILSFTRALGEFGATLMIAGNIPGKTQTIPIAIFFNVESGNMQGAFFWVIMTLIISFSMIIILNYWSDKQQELIGKRLK